INFGIGCLASALGRPFQLEAVRCQRRGIELSFEAPGGDDLPARLNEIAQRKKIALRASTGLLRELALGRLERILPFGIFALRDGPRAPIFLGPERPAGMHEQQFDVPARSSIHENAGAALWHCPGLIGVRRATAGCGERSPASPRPEPRRPPSRAARAPWSPPGVRGSA